MCTTMGSIEESRSCSKLRAASRARRRGITKKVLLLFSAWHANAIVDQLSCSPFFFFTGGLVTICATIHCFSQETKSKLLWTYGLLCLYCLYKVVNFLHGTWYSLLLSSVSFLVLGFDGAMCLGQTVQVLIIHCCLDVLDTHAILIGGGLTFVAPKSIFD